MISIKVEGNEEMWFTYKAARDLQRDLDRILGPHAITVSLLES